MILRKTYKDKSVFQLNYDLYNQINHPKHKQEYTLDDLKHPMYNRIREAYYQSPWHKIRKFKYKNNLCTCTGITFVYDSGFVLRLNYQYVNDDKCINYYRYIKNINSLKYLKLLKLKDIEVVEYQEITKLSLSS
jgi:hypothetical protein